jgi:hypothetical protein
MKVIINLFLVFFVATVGNCQTDSLNQFNENGQRSGYWIIYSHMNLDKGYADCDSCKIEEGTYINDRKEGVWTKYYKDGINPRLQGTYIDNRPNGNYTKFDLNGSIIEEGNFTPGKRVEVFRSGFYPNQLKGDIN